MEDNLYPKINESLNSSGIKMKSPNKMQDFSVRNICTTKLIFFDMNLDVFSVTSKSITIVSFISAIG